MSRGPGTIEQRIGDLFAATRDRALSIADISDYAFALNGVPANRKQRLSATRAAHRLVRRVQQSRERARKLVNEAHAHTKAALGREERHEGWDVEYNTLLHSLPAWRAREKLDEFCDRIGTWMRVYRGEQRGTIRGEADFWCATTKEGRLYFHPPDVPMLVWAVTIDERGPHWFDAEVVRITERNVIVRYAGEVARLSRERLWYRWAWWRGVRFVSSRTGRIAWALEEAWWERYGTAGSVPPVMQMPLADAIALLGVPQNYTRDDVIAAFRRAVKKAHPDLGGTADDFRKLVEVRDRLLAALGTSAPPPKTPSYYPSGATIVYRSGTRRSNNRLGFTRRLAHS